MYRILKVLMIRLYKTNKDRNIYEYDNDAIELR